MNCRTGTVFCWASILCAISPLTAHALTAGFFRLGGVCIMLISVSASAQQTPPHWSYSGHEGPNEWGKLDSTYAACSSGKTQSPIDIKGAQKADLPVLKFEYNSVPLNIIDNGHTIQVNYPAGSTLTVGKKLYMLQQFHFHHPSEEHVNGHAYDMVVHLVHSDAEGHLGCGRRFLEGRQRESIHGAALAKSSETEGEGSRCFGSNSQRERPASS
jgi:carbonic anhydrase